MNPLKHMRNIIPAPFRPAAEKWWYRALEIVDRLAQGKAHPIPPRKLRTWVGAFSNPRRYRKIGGEYLEHFRKLCSLRPDEKILDIGCGCGQVASALANYLQRPGSYEGFDTMGELIQWSEENISLRHPNFHFQTCDVFNRFYNPGGRWKAAEYRFPYDSESFDFVFAKSVFTHMLPRDVENYFAEISRVLKGDGRCLLTFFLLNSESWAGMQAGKSLLNFSYQFDGYHSVNEQKVEAGISYDENFITGLFAKYRLNIIHPIHFGSWCGRLEFLSFQDLIVAQKTRSEFPAAKGERECGNP